MASTVLIIDDEKKLNSLLARILGLEGFNVLQAYTAKEGLKILADQDVNVVLSDVKLPDVNGVELVKQIRAIKSYVEVINLTAFGTIQDGVLAIKNGAFDYITKGDDNDKIIPLVHKAMDKALLQQRVQALEKKVNKRYGFESIIGRTKAIQQAVAMAKKVAVTDATVLLLGETGTGKEVFAQAIHQESNRRDKDFVALNCSAFTAELIESELFGHKAGAFTSAIKDKKGLFEEANGGTLFLDEIGEMNIGLQAKLLRVLESGEFIKVGDTKTIKVNVRIIAATNRNLEQEAEKGAFRSDLFYRLSVFSIQLPALRERKEDIAALASHYLKAFALKANMQVSGMDAGFIKQLEAHPWKGNIRELKNLIERSVILSNTDTLTAGLLPIEFFSQADEGLSALDLAYAEKVHIRKVLHLTKGNKTEAARLMNIGLTTLYRKIEEYQLS